MEYKEKMINVKKILDSILDSQWIDDSSFNRYLLKRDKVTFHLNYNIHNAVGINFIVSRHCNCCYHSDVLYNGIEPTAEDIKVTLSKLNLYF